MIVIMMFEKTSNNINSSLLHFLAMILVPFLLRRTVYPFKCLFLEDNDNSSSRSSSYGIMEVLMCKIITATTISLLGRFCVDSEKN